MTLTARYVPRALRNAASCTSPKFAAFGVEARRHLKTLRVAGVPEHFFAPFHIAKERGLYEAHGVDFKWQMTPEGTGKMAQDLEAGHVDVALMVSEGAVAKTAAGAPFKVIGTYVHSPLRLGVHVRAGSQIATLGDLKGKVFGISRMGSSSHLMSHVLASQQGWDVAKDAPLMVVNNFDGAKKAMAAGEIDVWVWERFTTKQMVDSGEWELVSELPTPWHPFLFVASDKALAELSTEIRAAVEVTQKVCAEFKANHAGSTIEYLSKHHHLSEVDAVDWLDSTEWACKLEVDQATLDKTQEALVIIGQLQEPAPSGKILGSI